MQLRKDPDYAELGHPGRWRGHVARHRHMPTLPGGKAFSSQTIYAHTGNCSGEVRVTPHLCPLYCIEGDAQRRAEGIYDKMRSLGAHEIVVENPDHPAARSPSRARTSPTCCAPIFPGSWI